MQRTCKQLRTEYSPIYLQLATVAISWDDIELYQSEFYPRAEKSTTVPRNLHVYIGRYQGLHTSGRTILRLLTMRAHRDSITVQFIPDISSMYSDLVNDDCFILNLAFELDDPIWLDLLRRKMMLDARVFPGMAPVGMAPFGIFTNTERWTVHLRGVRSDMGVERLAEIRESVGAMILPPEIRILDWVKKKDRKNGETLKWVAL